MAPHGCWWWLYYPLKSFKLLICCSSGPARLFLDQELSQFIPLIHCPTRMAARRSCVNSLWSGSERVRIGERLKATLAGVLELEVLRCKHLEMVDAALEDRAPAGADGAVPGPGEESGTPESSATSRRQQVSQHGSLHAQIIKYECRNDRHLPKSHPLPPPTHGS